MRRLLVTSWSDKGYEQYGRKFLQSWKETGWDAVPLVVFHEGREPDEPGPTYLDLTEDRDLQCFHARWGDKPAANGIGKLADGRLVQDYRWQACKFARKVFAVTSDRLPDADWRIWIDGDVVFKRGPDEAFWAEVTPEDAHGSYIGRVDWHHSECGWVAYRMPANEHFLDTFRFIYSSGEVFKLDEWHDSFVWDWWRKQGFKAHTWKNLAEGVRGMHPWPETILGRYMDHHKGPVAKKEFYG